MRIIIAGAGGLGRDMAGLAAREGHEVTLVDIDHELVGRLRDTADVAVVHGDACEPLALEEIGALRADVLIACTGDDEDNLVISLLAKRTFDIPKVVARVNNSKNAWLFTGRWGVDHAVSASAALLPIIQEAAGTADTVGLVRLARSGVGLVETTLTEGSRAVGRTLAELALPKGVIVASVVRDDRPHVPDGAFRLAEGDEVLVVTGDVSADRIRTAFH